MATYESIASAHVDDSNSLTITKPTGLEADDLLVAGIFCDRDSGAGPISLNTPSGWTLQESVALTSSNAALAIYTKIADSSDAAASNFTFTAGFSSGQYMIGHLLRFSSPGTDRGGTSGIANQGTTTQTLAGFTPTAGATHVLFTVIAAAAVTGNYTAVSYATDNPTWTERGDLNEQGTTTDATLAVYTATRSATTATGTITTTLSEDVASDRGAIAVLAYSTQTNGSISQETQLNAYALSPIQSAVVDAVVEDPTLRAINETMWTEEDVPTTTWTNEDI